MNQAIYQQNPHIVAKDEGITVHSPLQKRGDSDWLEFTFAMYFARTVTIGAMELALDNIR